MLFVTHNYKNSLGFTDHAKLKTAMIS